MKLLKTPEQHADALVRIADLLARGENRNPDEQDECEVLLVLIKKYEDEHRPIVPPTPVEAIRFRMDQMGYRQKDLAELVGGASRASEILAGKRGLTVEMIRRLRDEWHIPADCLVGGAEPPEPEPSAPTPGAEGQPGPKDYPLKQMYDRGYFPGFRNDWQKHGKDRAGLLRDFLGLAAEHRFQPLLCRQTGSGKAKLNPHALEAWQLRVMLRAAEEKKSLVPYDAAGVDEAFLRWLVGLSTLDRGPLLVIEELEKRGIGVIIEPHLDRTHLDGAAILAADGRPVIGLTLRHDRLDNFWFTLFHEIGHVVLGHLTPERRTMVDRNIDQKKTQPEELEADRFALATLIPPQVWEDQVKHLHYAVDIRAAAGRLCVSPAVIAGRLRREANDFRLHRTLVGYDQVKPLFGLDAKK